MPEIITAKTGSLGRITLNRPEALNALNLAMVEEMTAALLAWRDDEQVRAVVVDGAGEKGFCAGGDIRMLAESGKAKDGRAETFWREEYRLNALIAEYPKPYVALIDGVTMGGGVGVSMHGRFRVAGDRTVFAMPETGIGFHPDVGGSYFLPRLPGGIGRWCGLTGARLKAPDCFAAGIATHYVASDRMADLAQALEAAELDDDGGAVEATIAAFESDPGEAPLAPRRADIERLFAGETVEAIGEALRADGSEWAVKQADMMAAKSPTSLKITLEAIARGGEMELRECLAMELGVSVRILDGHDFYEGVRAVIVDKDNAPRWEPAALEAVDAGAVARHFDPEGAPAIAFIEAA